MSVFCCHECGRYVDNDWHPCEEHPAIPNELVCEGCFAEMPGPSLEIKQGGVFTKAQQAIIDREEMGQ